MFVSVLLKFNVKKVRSIEKWAYLFPTDFVTHHKKRRGLVQIVLSYSSGGQKPKS